MEPNSQLKSKNSFMLHSDSENFRSTLQKGKLRPGEVSECQAGVSLISNPGALALCHGHQL